MNNNSTIKCPNCNHEFPIGNALAQSIENDIRQRYLTKYNEDKKKLNAEKLELARYSEDLQKQKENIEYSLREKLNEEKIKIQEEASKKAEEENQLKIKFLKEVFHGL